MMEKAQLKNTVNAVERKLHKSSQFLLYSPISRIKNLSQGSLQSVQHTTRLSADTQFE